MLSLMRMWVNQPSKSNRFHKYHGMNVIASTVDEYGFIRIWFTSGAVISTEIRKSALSIGWKQNGR